MRVHTNLRAGGVVDSASQAAEQVIKEIPVVLRSAGQQAEKLVNNAFRSTGAFISCAAKSMGA